MSLPTHGLIFCHVVRKILQHYWIITSFVACIPFGTFMASMNTYTNFLWLHSVCTCSPLVDTCRLWICHGFDINILSIRGSSLEGEAFIITDLSVDITIDDLWTSGIVLSILMVYLKNMFVYFPLNLKTTGRVMMIASYTLSGESRTWFLILFKDSQGYTRD